MKGFDIELSQFITIKQKQATEDKIANTENPDGLVNGTIDTNVGLLRAYMTMYLRRHPFHQQRSYCSWYAHWLQLKTGYQADLLFLHQ